MSVICSHGYALNVLVAPNEVPLVVKEKDSCNSGKDIYFQLVGFTLKGQVCTMSLPN